MPALLRQSLVCLLLCQAATAQVPLLLSDSIDLARRKDFRALRSSSNNPDPLSNDDSKRPIPGETVVLADLRGPGMVTHIWLTVAANEYGWPRLLRLRVYYDGSPVPSVDAPVGDFFAVGHGFERDINSLLVRNSSSGRSRNCYWPMPFRRACKITVTNEGRRRVSNLYYHVDWRKLPALPAGTRYLHALYRQELPAAAGKPYEVLSVQGQGHYVGTVLSVIQTRPGWFGEGDDLFYVDGEKEPSLEGTGTEDYFNDAWSLRTAEGPYTGVPVAEGTGVGSRMTAYRWHTPDPIPFTRSLRFVLEHAGWTYNPSGSVRSAFEERPDLFSSVAFWYQLGIAKNMPEPPYGMARLPHGNATQIEAENLLRDVRAERGAPEVQREVFWSKDLLFFRPEGPGARIEIPFEVREDGQWELAAQIARAPDYGIYEVLVDGRRIGSDRDLEPEPGANPGGTREIDAWGPEIYVAQDYLLGWFQFSRGRHHVTFVCTGKNERSDGFRLGIDSLILARIGRPAPTGGAQAAEIRRLGARGAGAFAELTRLRSALADSNPLVREAAAWAFTQMGESAAPATSELTRVLYDPDPVARGLAALALRNIGKQAVQSLRALIEKLKDRDENVRLMVAEAIASQGELAATAVPALIQACKVQGEHVHVQRSLAAALGAIGPKAAPALPVLRKLETIPRVRWAARAAIRRIEGGK